MVQQHLCELRCVRTELTSDTAVKVWFSSIFPSCTRITSCEAHGASGQRINIMVIVKKKGMSVTSCSSSDRNKSNNNNNNTCGFQFKSEYVTNNCRLRKFDIKHFSCLCIRLWQNAVVKWDICYLLEYTFCNLRDKIV